MSIMKFKSGRDAAVFLRNDLLRWMKIAKEYNIDIRAIVSKSGDFGNIIFGDYECSIYDDEFGYKERYIFCTKDDFGKNKHVDVRPEQINIGKREEKVS